MTDKGKWREANKGRQLQIATQPGVEPPCVRYSPSVVSLQSPGQSPVYSSPHDAASILS